MPESRSYQPNPIQKSNKARKRRQYLFEYSRNQTIYYSQIEDRTQANTSMKALTIIPAAEQSKTYIEGVLNHESRSLIGKGIYCV